jgi:hypothetical protein
MLSKSAAGMSSTVATLEARLRDLDRAMKERVAAAPADGIVEMLELRPGDRVPPGGPVAVLIVPGEYVCEFVVKGLAPGVAVTVLAGGLRIAARVDRVEARRLPVVLREDRREEEEVVARARFSSETPIAPGSAVRVELP